MTNPFANFGSFAAGSNGTAPQDAAAAAAAAPAPAYTIASNNYGKTIASKHKDTVVSLSGPRAEELSKVLMFLDRGYGSNTLLEYARIDESDDVNLRGRVVLTIPPEAFFGQNPGQFQFRAAWPELDRNGLPVLKVTLNYIVEANGNNAMLQAGGGTGDNSGWTNINSQKLSFQEMLEAGYFDEAAIPEIFAFIMENLGSSSAILTLTPKSPVTVVLRNTIVPNRPSKGDISGRTITPKGGKVAGDDAGLGMAFIHFTNATVLPKLSSLLLDEATTAKLTPKLGLGDLAARYGINRPVAQVTPQGANVANSLASYM